MGTVVGVWCLTQGGHDELLGGQTSKHVVARPPAFPPEPLPCRTNGIFYESQEVRLGLDLLDDLQLLVSYCTRSLRGSIWD